MRHQPGPGWKHLGSAVWENNDGLRIAVGGAYRLPDGTFVSGEQWPQSKELYRWIRIAGGNRKRGVMLWAMHETAKEPA